MATSCGHSYNRGYFVLLLILPVAAIGQLKSLAFTMGTMNINTSVPLYGCGLIILPSTSAIVILGERPSIWAGFVGSILSIIVFNIIFLRLVHVRQEQLTSETKQEQLMKKQKEGEAGSIESEPKKVELTVVGANQV